MFTLIKSINENIEDFYNHLKGLKLKAIVINFLLTGFITGLILGGFSFIERIFSYGQEISLFNKLIIASFSISTLGLFGLALALIELILFLLFFYSFIFLSNLSKTFNKVYPYKTIILYTVFTAALTGIIYIKVFINNDFNLEINQIELNMLFTTIFNSLFILIVIISAFLIIYSLKLTQKKAKVKHKFSIKNLSICLLFIIITIIGIYYFTSVFSNSWQANEWLNNYISVPYNSFWNDYLKLFSNNEVVFKINLIISLFSLYLFLNYFTIFIIAKVYKYKFSYIILLVLTLIPFIFMYFISQNIFTNNLFLKVKMTIIIISIAIFTFALLHWFVFTLYITFKDLIKSKINIKKTLLISGIIYIALFLIGLIGINNNNIIRAFIYRHCVYEKISHHWPILIGKKPELFTLPFKMNYINHPKPLNKNISENIKPPNVFLIIVDALRSDVVEESLKNKNSALAKITKDFYYFNNCYSNSTYTVASISSIFTSKYLSSRSDFHLPTIAEILSGNYTTLSINNFKKYYKFDTIIIDNKKYPSLFSKGFDINDKTSNENFNALKDLAIALKLKRFLKNYKQTKPIFAYLHYSELHLIPASILSKNIFSGNNFLNTYKKVYANEEKNVVELIKLLKEYDTYNNSLIIITSDHGEGAKEHGDLFHVFSLYEEIIKVPLFIKLPEQKHGKRFNNPVSLIDITPTILDYLNYDLKKYDMNGRSLLPLLNNAYFTNKPVFSSVYMFNNNNDYHFSLYGSQGVFDKSVIEVAVIDSNNEWKLIYNLYYDFKELYNLKTDPLERNNLISNNHQIVEQLLQELHNTLFLKK